MVYLNRRERAERRQFIELVLDLMSETLEGEEKTILKRYRDNKEIEELLERVVKHMGKISYEHTSILISEKEDDFETEDFEVIYELSQKFVEFFNHNVEEMLRNHITRMIVDSRRRKQEEGKSWWT